MFWVRMGEFVIVPVQEWMVVDYSVAEEVTKQEYEMSKDSVTAGSYGVVT